MAEYINREACLSILRAKANMAVLMDAAPYFEKAAQMLEKLPAADVAPVVHGVWEIMEGTKTRRICSKCGWDVPEYGKFYSYCPNCGARMDGDGNV